jgi:metal-responsive CopG/Arc/MetJ family transcriptional regulator
MTDTEKVQVNAGEMPVPLVAKLDAMCAEDENSRTQFIRKLIRQEWERRQQIKLSVAVDSSVSETTVVKKGTKRASAAVPA